MAEKEELLDEVWHALFHLLHMIAWPDMVDEPHKKEAIQNGEIALNKLYRHLQGETQ